MSKKLYVGNIPWDATEDELSDLFKKVGKVVDATIIIDRDSGRSKGFGFIEMSSEEEAKKAIGTINGVDFKGRKLIVNEARPREERN